MEDKSLYLVISGNHTSTKSVTDYVSHIVYGNPRIDAVEVGSHFVAICEYSPLQKTQWEYTFGRMGSFPHGASCHWDKVSALTEFGSLVYQWAPGTIVGAFAPTAEIAYTEIPEGQSDDWTDHIT